jgi:hypothetical protein
MKAVLTLLQQRKRSTSGRPMPWSKVGLCISTSIVEVPNLSDAPHWVVRAKALPKKLHFRRRLIASATMFDIVNLTPAAGQARLDFLWLKRP